MLTAMDFFELSQLAEASYANFSVPEENYDEALEDKGFSSTQATDFLSNWLVVTHQPNTTSGFSSTLFKSTDPAGGYVLALRGTEAWSADFTADGDIVADGLAITQIVDMYNEWQRINGAAAGTYSAARLSYLTAESEAFVDANLKLSSSDPDICALAQSAIDAFKLRTDIVFDGMALYTIEFVDSGTLFNDGRETGLGLANEIAEQGLTITGHSLGGHLATAFTRLFPALGADALTINGAGYPTGSTPGISGMALINIANLFSMLGGATAFDTSSIVNVFGEDMPEFVTMNRTWGLVRPGPHLPVFIEQDTFIACVKADEFSMGVM